MSRNMGVLAENEYNWSSLGFCGSTTSNDFEVANLVVIDTTDVNGPVAGRDDSDVIACDTTICSPIN